MSVVYHVELDYHSRLLLEGRLLQMGVMAIDVGLTNPPRHQRASQASAEPLRSYVLDHPGAYIDHRLDGLESSHA